jgi:hypothetical protein
VAEASANRRFFALATLWAIASGAFALAPGCYGHNCDGDVKSFGTAPNEGRLVNADTWESGPIDGPWLPFPHQRIWIFDLHELGDRTPDLPVAYVSANLDPDHEGANFVQGGGNLTELSSPEKGKLVVKNGTCADYYLRLVVQASPFPPAAPADASAPDASDAGP